MNTCPVCQARLENNRCYSIEKLVNKIHPVVFYCPGIYCNERVSQKKFEEHIQMEEHDFNEPVLCDKNSISRQYTTFERTTDLFDLDGTWPWTQILCTFSQEKFYSFFIKDGGFFHFWIYYRGEKEASEKYLYEVKFSNGDHTLSYKGHSYKGHKGGSNYDSLKVGR